VTKGKVKQEIKWRLQRLKNIYHWLTAVMAVIMNGYPAKKLKVIGVTGTDGKTTTSTLIYEMLKATGMKAGLLTTVEAKMGGQSVDTGLHTTNPDPRQLQPLLWKMVDKGMEYAVLEVTAHGLDQYRVLGCNFWIGVLTNVTHEHLDDFVDMERYRRAKLKLFQGVKYAVLNGDDKNYEFF
jgi:UDP-N-acetylmuramoyl-L-alanyl-D-glutamate--2,6-diaminopimelate ligase